MNPPGWTDADGTTQCVELGGDPKFSLIGLRELLKLVDAYWVAAVPPRTMSGAASGGDKSRLALPTRVDVRILPE